MNLRTSRVSQWTALSLAGAMLIGGEGQAEPLMGYPQGIGQGTSMSQGPTGMPSLGAGYWVPVRIYGWPSGLPGMPAVQGSAGIPGLPVCQGTSNEEGTWVWIPKARGGDAGGMGPQP